MSTQFSASQTIELAVPEQPIPIQHYLRQPQRLIQSLVAPSRVESLEDKDCFRLKMRPLSFMTLRIQPTVDMRVWATSDGTIHLQSIGCEIRGVEYVNQRFSLSLVGRLAPRLTNHTTYLEGRADLQVRVELPPPFLLTPKPVLETAGNGLLRSVLLTMKQRLTHQLLVDYRAWVAMQMKEAEGADRSSTLLSPNLSSNHSAI